MSAMSVAAPTGGCRHALFAMPTAAPTGGSLHAMLVAAPTGGRRHVWLAMSVAAPKGGSGHAPASVTTRKSVPDITLNVMTVYTGQRYHMTNWAYIQVQHLGAVRGTACEVGMV